MTGGSCSALDDLVGHSVLTAALVAPVWMECGMGCSVWCEGDVPRCETDSSQNEPDVLLGLVLPTAPASSYIRRRIRNQPHVDLRTTPTPVNVTRHKLRRRSYEGVGCDEHK